MKKTLFVFTFLACAPQTNAMLIEALPQELKIKIYISTESLLESAKTINSLARTSKSLNIFINDPDRTLIFIKELAQKFNCSDEKVANILYTEAAKDRYKLQHKLGHEWPLYSETAQHLFTEPNLKEHQGLDLNFTYEIEDQQMSGLMIISTSKINNQQIPLWLIEQGADINILARNGTNAFMFALYRDTLPDLIQCFLDHPDLHINHQNTDGDTPLLYSLYKLEDKDGPMPNSIYIRLCAIVQQVLDKGADPELSNHNGQTPLGLATNIGYQPLIELIKNAIVKKHKKTS